MFEEDYLKELHQKSQYSKQSRKVRRILDSLFSEIVSDRMAEQQETTDRLVSQEVMKPFLRQEVIKDQSGDMVQLSFSTDSSSQYSFFVWHEGPDAVSGDFFNLWRLDDKTVVMLLGECTGLPSSGVTKALVMTRQQALCDDYFRLVRERRGINPKTPVIFENLLYRLNDSINESDTRAYFSALQFFLINNDTGDYRFNHAGSNCFYHWDSRASSLNTVTGQEAPAAGQVDSQMIRMKNEISPEPGMFKDANFNLPEKDFIISLSDGLEESRRTYRNDRGASIQCFDFPDEVLAKDIAENPLLWKERLYFDPGLYDTCQSSKDWKPFIDSIRESEKNHPWGLTTGDQFGSDRIESILTAVLTAGSFELKRRFDILVSEPLIFDFSDLVASPENAVLAVLAVEKVFRLVPAPAFCERDVIRIDRQIETFLRLHFTDFEKYFSHPPDRSESDIQYSYYSHLQEDPMNDDRTIMAYQRLTSN